MRTFKIFQITSESRRYPYVFLVDEQNNWLLFIHLGGSIKRSGSRIEAPPLENGFQCRKKKKDVPSAGRVPHQTNTPYSSGIST